ncbi:hypothetical protein JAAARDRAFT_456418 [Jaapia argillacea MUCL 33604]|uniref:Ras-GEF domain-containing protein n=1 Tax=Jaapia argillacea MUCL 33604 TaxID=933084 RepID=A0A067Q5I1_9AGAM|nr:hypothetical protein JAAARDRAFT_456418 [Jaapia argillacea MUCL 33604]
MSYRTIDPSKIGEPRQLARKASHASYAPSSYAQRPILASRSSTSDLKRRPPQMIRKPSHASINSSSTSVVPFVTRPLNSQQDYKKRPRGPSFTDSTTSLVGPDYHPPRPVPISIITTTASPVSSEAESSPDQSPTSSPSSETRSLEFNSEREVTAVLKAHEQIHSLTPTSPISLTMLGTLVASFHRTMSRAIHAFNRLPRATRFATPVQSRILELQFYQAVIMETLETLPKPGGSSSPMHDSIEVVQSVAASAIKCLRAVLEAIVDDQSNQLHDEDDEDVTEVISAEERLTTSAAQFAVARRTLDPTHRRSAEDGAKAQPHPPGLPYPSRTVAPSISASSYDTSLTSSSEEKDSGKKRNVLARLRTVSTPTPKSPSSPALASLVRRFRAPKTSETTKASETALQKAIRRSLALFPDCRLALRPAPDVAVIKNGDFKKYVGNPETVLAATWPALVRLVTSGAAEADPTLTESVFLARRLHSTPKEFFDLLLQRYEGPPAESLPTKAKRRAIESHDRKTWVAKVLSLWVEMYWNSPGDDIIRERLLYFVATTLSVDFPAVSASLTTSLEKVARPNNPQASRSTDPSIASLADITNILAFDSAVGRILLAEQLSLITSAVQRAVDPIQYILRSLSNASGEKKLPTTPQEIEVSLLPIRLTIWICTLILDKTTANERGMVIELMLDVGMICLQQRDLCSAMAITDALTHECISRLHESFSFIPDFDLRLKELTGQMPGIRGFIRMEEIARDSKELVQAATFVFRPILEFLRQSQDGSARKDIVCPPDMIHLKGYSCHLRVLRLLDQTQVLYPFAPVGSVQSFLADAIDTMKSKFPCTRNPGQDGTDHIIYMCDLVKRSKNYEPVPTRDP